MASLFSYGDVKNRPSRSGFDLSNKFAFTAKAGQILPVYWDLVLPGTKFNLKNAHFTRTTPVNTAAYTRIKEYFDWYFVPLRLINKNLNQALVNMVDQPVQAASLLENKQVVQDIPHVSAADLYNFVAYIDGLESGTVKYDLNGFKKSSGASRLLRYLRYGNPYFNKDVSNFKGGLSESESFTMSCFNNLNMNILPLAAYQKIYCDWFRFEQWEKACPYTYNFDYYGGGNVLYGINYNTFFQNDNFLTLRYCNYNKDLFMGVMPSAQFGSVAMVSIASSGTFSGASGPGVVLRNLNSAGSSVAASNAALNPLVLKQVEGTVSAGNTFGFVVSDLKSSFDILSFRIAEASQKYKEVTQCAKQGYKEQLEAHWNVRLSEALSDHCRYIGGDSADITISEVLNNNLSATDAAADIKGKGVGTGSGSEVFEANEHGILMCIYHAVPVLDYILSGHDYQLMHTLTTDLPQPEFDHIGMEALPIATMFDDFTTEGKIIMNNISTIGYSPRYIGYKTKVDWISGAFETSLSSWVTPLTVTEQITKLLFGGNGATAAMNYGFFKVTPRVLDPIFIDQCDDTWDSDQFLVNVFFDVKAVQNLDYNGLPY